MSRTRGKQWLKIDLGQGSAAGAQLGSLRRSADPTQVLSYLRGVGEPVSAVGTETVRGAKTTHYRGQVDLGRAAQQGAVDQPTVAGFTRQFGSSRFPVDVWVDGQGRAGRTSYMLKPVSGAGSFTFTQEMYDFGGAGVKALPAPPADQVLDINQLATAAGTPSG